VVFSSWTYDTGYVIGIQHSNNLVSFYKHNSNLLKSTGDKVLAGDIIATIGNTGELTTGPHLHFELWFKGKPINPKELIIF
jgi:murein DD-endopeptidase MepM/ murein hydrolase activator NlpD